MMEPMIIHISVRELVEFLLRSGDIDNRIKGTDTEAMQLGGRLHRRIQKAQGPEYRAEVPLSHTVHYEGFSVEVEGRADGIITGEPMVIDEIKGVFRDLSKMEEPVPVHLAQAKVYAAIYALTHGDSGMGVQMTYGNLETEEIRTFAFSFASEELISWFENLIDSYYPWAKFSYDWHRTRNESARNAVFPFPYRKGQKKTAAAVYHTILNEKKLFLQAPTGVGKTIAAVFPGVKAVGEGLIDKIFYLTARTTTQQVAADTFHILAAQGLSFKVLTLTAKEKICFLDEPDCNPEACPFAKGHFDRVNSAVYDLLINETDVTRDTIRAYAQKHTVCPFELSLDLSCLMDAVLCDYNYLFDPNAKLRRFFSEGARKDYLFLIDEAHNLVDRGREMFSASLSLSSFRKIRGLVKEEEPALYKRLSACIRDLNKWKKAAEEADHVLRIETLENFPIHLLNMEGELEEVLDERNQDEVREELLNFFFEVREFLAVEELLDEKYTIYADGAGEAFTLHLFCADPSGNLQAALLRGKAAVFLSATLLPIRYYRALLGADEEDYAIYAESPFDPAHRLILQGTDVTTRYTKRGESMYRAYAAYLLSGMTGRSGNYMAFFPSYRFLQEVEAAFRDLCSVTNLTPEILVQEPQMTEQEKEGFLESFREGERERSLIGFCVMGGVFSEGIDLTGESLIGAFVCGTAIPQVCNEREILKTYFDEHGSDGFAYAYLYAGINRVLQAAGRVIRTAEDQGIIWLLDERFSARRYRELFPREWKSVLPCSLRNAAELSAGFWERGKGEEE